MRRDVFAVFVVMLVGEGRGMNALSSNGLHRTSLLSTASGASRQVCRSSMLVGTTGGAARTIPEEDLKLPWWKAIQGAWSSGTFAEFMSFLRNEAGDCILLDAWPVLPPVYLLMGKAANQCILSDADPSLDQVLQQLINALPVAARVPVKTDEALQRKVSALFQSERVVNLLIPSFKQRAEQICKRWASMGPKDHVSVFAELSDYVLLADLEVLYGTEFANGYAERLLPSFKEWVENIAHGGNPTTFFSELGIALREYVEQCLASPESFASEESVLQLYMSENAENALEIDDVVGLLSMTLMAATFNTQVCLAWILVHLYSQPELLESARTELRCQSELDSYATLANLTFINACIDESVRLHTMLPGNTVIRKANSAVIYRDDSRGDVHIPMGAVIWLYPNAVHLDEAFFPEPKAFCPMRMLHGNLERMSSEFELVTFGHGRQRCIGEKMVSAKHSTSQMRYS